MTRCEPLSTAVMLGCLRAGRQRGDSCRLGVSFACLPTDGKRFEPNAEERQGEGRPQHRLVKNW